MESSSLASLMVLMISPITFWLPFILKFPLSELVSSSFWGKMLNGFSSPNEEFPTGRHVCYGFFWLRLLALSAAVVGVQ